MRKNLAETSQGGGGGMSVYAALLRGINVGGKHRVNMAELKGTLEDAGFANVRTYIQSGNVLFEADGEETDLREKMEQVIEKRFGFPVPVILRTSRELQAIIDGCPFTPEEVHAADSNSGVESLHVCMLLSEPELEAVEKLKTIPSNGDRFLVCGRDIYLLVQNGVHNSKLAAQISKMKTSVTARNFKTMRQLALLANDMGE
jgi:uncharacterized protein (DUF1697 family)